MVGIETKFKKVYVVEELEPFIENELKANGITNIVGKELFPITGELEPNIIKEKISNKKIIERFKPKISIPPRPPKLCPGCPHHQTFNVLNT